MISLWQEINTAPKNGRVFIAKSIDNKEFYCQYASLPNSLGYYSFLKLVDYKDAYTPYDIVEASPTHWREIN